MPSASACAYLVIAGVVAAGLDGLARELPLPPPRQGGAEGAAPLPTSLPSALHCWTLLAEGTARPTSLTTCA